MAEGVIFPVAADLISKLGSLAFQEIGLIYGLEEQLAKLKDSFSAIKSVLLDAEQKQDQSHAVRDWLGKLKDVAYDAEDLLDELSYESLRREVITRDKKAKKVRIFFSKHNLVAFGSKMVHKIKKIRERLDFIAADRTQFHFKEAVDGQTKNKEREYTHSFVREEEVIGRDEQKEEVVKRLLEINEKKNVSVDAIVGIGGLGKTMLAQSVFNHKRVENGFDLRLWVCVSEVFDVKIIVEKIIESATNQKPSELEMNSLQSQLRRQIDGKKYLLVMDDVWNEEAEIWVSLRRLLMGGADGSKILITTRSKLVAEISEATSPYVLDGLSESNSWILFKQLAFKEGEEPENPNMIKIGKEIVEKCKGVPLVIRSIARLLYFKTSETEWLNFRDNELLTITQQENKITQMLKLSYDHLPFHLKPCFAYCSLFPKDFVFEKDKLVKLWVAEGFVQSQGENKCEEDVGNEYFMDLIWRSLFQDAHRNEFGETRQCKIHDLMHDLAQLVSGTEYITGDLDTKIVTERTRRVSFECAVKPTWSRPSSSLIKANKLRTFFWSGKVFYETSNKLKKDALDALILSFVYLRLLDLSHLNIKQVPGSIGELKHLRFLDLSGNGEIKLLPNSITKLHNLQTLNLRFCSSLRELPTNIESLVNLRHLYLSENNILKLLSNSVTKLHFLQTLNLNNCSKMSELPRDIGNMVSLKFLHFTYNWIMELLPNSITKLSKLQTLDLSYCSSLTELPRDIGNMVNLRHLYLEGCDGLRDIPLGLDKLTCLQTMNLYVVGPSVSYEESGLCELNKFINLRGRLHIKGLDHLRKYASQTCNVNLKDNHGINHFSLEWNDTDDSAEIVNLDTSILEDLRLPKNVESLSIIGYGGVSLSRWLSSFPILMIIKIVKCRGLEHLPRFDRLPLLQSLTLRNIDRVEYIDNNEIEDGSYSLSSSDFFPSLQSLELIEMPNLKRWWKPREFSTKDPGQSRDLPALRCLSSLIIRYCPQLMISIPCHSPLKTLRHSNVSAEMSKGELMVSRTLLESPSSKEAPSSSAHFYSGYSVLSKLKSLELCGIDSLEVLPDEFLLNLISLRDLEIKNCANLCFSQPQVNSCENYKNLIKKEDHAEEALKCLRSLRFEGLPKLVCLPKGLQHSTALQSLDIENCNNLLLLPEWIGNLTSLKDLKIWNCPKVTSLPQGIRELLSLRFLSISKCPILAQRCNQQTGEDWLKIAHVRNIRIQPF